MLLPLLISQMIVFDRVGEEENIGSLFVRSKPAEQEKVGTQKTRLFLVNVVMCSLFASGVC